MVVAPAAVPRPIVDRLHGELETIMALPETRNAITRIGLIPAATGASVEELQAFMRSEIARWGEVVKRSGASID
jgi:tripartite-type tricarboxylate transporter receptor subunit TctC